MPSPGPFYITTPIYYVNDRPHIGHCYTTIVADVAARMQRLARGEPHPAPPGARPPGVFLLTGTDEHADKVVTSAAAHGKTPQEWADLNAAEFRRAFDLMGVAYDDFIRTTEPRHKDRATRYIAALMKSGDVYRGEYTGWYDAGQEEYVTENTAREHQYKSPINGKPLVKRTEPCYFFRLQKYWAPLRAHIDANPSFIEPAARRSEVLGRLVNEDPRDVPISRPVTDDPATQWGIRVPGDPANRVYVWIDALFNYLSAIDTDERRSLWPPAVHLLGKDILWFHAVIWPALLMALKGSGPDYAWVDLPRTIFGHGWWISEGQKMSKSLGNFIDLEKMQAYASRYSLDALRWYLATQGPLAGSDSDFSHTKFVETFNADLANGIGNSTSRVANMIGKYFGGRMPEPHQPPAASTPQTPDLPQHASTQAARWAQHAARLELSESLRAAVQLVGSVDSYINATEPFKLAKLVDADPSRRPLLGGILFNCAETLRIASLLMSPAMPAKMADLWKRWSCTPPAGVPLEQLARWGGPHALKPGSAIEKGDALFMRADPADPPPGA